MLITQKMTSNLLGVNQEGCGADNGTKLLAMSVYGESFGSVEEACDYPALLLVSLT